MALTAFLALVPCLRSVAYPNNFKPNIQKYDRHSDTNILPSTYYVTVKAAGGSFDHMAAYFPLVMGDAPSLWLNNLPAGSITSWADLSQAFCRMDLPGPTTSVGTRTDYSVGPWDYPTCVARYLMA
jgi:hypothetical protein